MKGITDPLLEIKEYGSLLDSLNQNLRPVSVIGPSDSQKAHLVFSVCGHTGKKALYIAQNEIQARKIYEDFSFFLGDDVLLFPSKEVIMHDIKAKSNQEVFARLNTLLNIHQKRFRLVVASAESVMHKLMPPDMYRRSLIHLTAGTVVNLTDLSQKLVELGYERADIVESTGQFAVRGGIVDIYPPNYDFAIRVEFFGDEVDSIRRFDPASQRSVEHMEEAVVTPSREIIYTLDMKPGITERIQKSLKEYEKKTEGSKLSERINADIDRIRFEHYFPGIDRYLPFIAETAVSVVDYLDDETVVFIDENRRVRKRMEEVCLEHMETCKMLMEKEQILPESCDIYFDYTDFTKKIASRKVVFLNSLTAEDASPFGQHENIHILSKSAGIYRGHIEMLARDLKEWKRMKNRVVILLSSAGMREGLMDYLKDNEIGADLSESVPDSVRPGQVLICAGSLESGFEYPSAGLIVLTDKEVYAPERKLGKKKVSKRAGSKISLFTDLKIGDYVVHQSHGIGQYVGVEQLVVDNVKRDYLRIMYRGGDSLYIPTSQLDLIQKYIGNEDRPPKLNKLGGTEWVKTKRKVKESLKELASELIKLYAQRQSLKGFAFSPDTVWQKQFEDMFPYQETPDQLKCIEEIKADMESEKVMDRLLCGDVGYGKTEVAVRAVFKAVMDGKQAAFLVPTTILAQQHYETFRERFREFPVTVDVISRFRTPAEQKRILKDVQAGNIDVLIGTHRLIQKDIKFKDLGLLVIDEEQRFGVEHKEKLKSLNPTVDVLTLTATPIPRTLHMSLTGIRDISVLEDPPEDRYPVQTYVMEYDSDVIRNAILRELARNGQVFYLYNRVRSIDMKAARIKELVPEARVAAAHGQMDERQLENVMIEFLNREYDVLVCTTIIESGLDMPNVNTIIVEDADRMGLSQLYQLRGRVGRSNVPAYAYITYRRDKIITEAAAKRLQAIKEFTEFGSGFKIAMRDLEIRGAGNLLGSQQHGHMEAVGYDMYCRLLDEAVRELKGEPPVQPESEITIDINVDAYIDDSYIENEVQKVEMYKKISSIQNEEDVKDIEDELVDRYGDLPQAVENLIMIAYIKALAREAGLSAVSSRKDAVIFQFAKNRPIDVKAVGKLAEKYHRQLLFNAGNSPYLLYRLPGKEGKKLLENIKIVLQDMKHFQV